MFTLLAAVASLWFLNAISSVRGALYVIDPLESTTCHGGKPCTVQWVDDGIQPLLTSIGACTVGLYHGEMELVQQIAPIDVSTAHSLEFTPNPNAGPNSNTYFIAFESTELKINGTSYRAYSTSFKIDQMRGSFDSPVPSLTSSIRIPVSVLNPPPNAITSTEFVGGASPTPTPTPSLATSTIAPFGPTPLSGSNGALRTPRMPLAGIFLIGLSFSCLY